MAPVDSLLNLVDRQGANELRLGSDREPQMFASGAQKRLVIPKTSTETLLTASQSFSQRLYEEASKESASAPGGEVPAEEANDDEVVDAEIVDPKIDDPKA